MKYTFYIRSEYIYEERQIALAAAICTALTSVALSVMPLLQKKTMMI